MLVTGNWMPSQSPTMCKHQKHKEIHWNIIIRNISKVEHMNQKVTEHQR